MEILFISDLHLQQEQPETSVKLVEFIKARATNARALYILGDLFEVWLGDDDDSPEFCALFDALRSFSQRANLYFMPGNRDFLVGSKLARKLGFEILAEPYLLRLGEQSVALMHGDQLCTDDVDYQNFRRMVRAPEWQQEFLSKSLAERRKIASGLRQRSTDAMQEKTEMIMDVNPETVNRYFENLNIDVLVHGHTHRPAVHGLPAGTRYVLGDWRPGPSYLSWNDGDWQLHDERV